MAYDDIYKLVQQQLAQSQGKGRNQFYDPTVDFAMKIPEMIQNERDAEKVQNREHLNTIASLFENVDTPDGMRNIISSVDSLSDKSGNDPEMQTSLNMMRGMANNWSQDYNMYKNAIDKGVSYVESDTFPTSIEDYQNLDKIASDAGYDTKLKYLFAEKEKINSLMDNIGVGISQDGKSRRFRYKGKDSSVLRKLNKHSQELDMAIKSLAGDKLITSDEAYHIMIGDTDFYDKKYKENVDASKAMIGQHLDSIEKLNSTINSIKKKQLFQSDVDMWGLSTAGLEYELDVNGNPTNQLTDNSVESLLNDLSIERLSINTKLNNSNERYKAWTGEDFGDFGTEKEMRNLFTETGGPREESTEEGTFDESGKLVTEESTEEEKIVKAKEEKLKLSAKSKTLDKSINLLGEDIDIYEPPSFQHAKKGYRFGTSDEKRIAKSLGEKSFKDVKENYVSASPGELKLAGKYGADYAPRAARGMTTFIPTNLKISDANDNLEGILNDYNMTIDDVSNYVTTNMGKEFENKFQSFLDKSSDGLKARDILNYLNPKLYKKTKGTVTNLLARIPGQRTPKGGDPGLVRGYNKNANSKQMTDYLKKWGVGKQGRFKNLDGYESLIMLYNFIGQEKGI